MSDVDPESLKWFADLRRGAGQAEKLDPQMRSILTVATGSAARDEVLQARAETESAARDKVLRERGREVSERLNCEQSARDAEHLRLGEKPPWVAPERRSLAWHAVAWAVVGLGLPVTAGILALTVRGHTVTIVAMNLFAIGAFGGAILVICLIVQLIVGASRRRPWAPPTPRGHGTSWRPSC